MNESAIIFEAGRFWVGRTRKPDSFTVYATGSVCSEPDSSYARTDAGRSIAIARCKYLARREEAKRSA